MHALFGKWMPEGMLRVLHRQLCASFSQIKKGTRRRKAELVRKFSRGFEDTRKGFGISHIAITVVGTDAAVIITVAAAAVGISQPLGLQHIHIVDQSLVNEGLCVADCLGAGRLNCWLSLSWLVQQVALCQLALRFAL